MTYKQKEDQMKTMGVRIVLGSLLGLAFGFNGSAAGKAPKLSLEQATAIASKAVAGTIKSSEFEHELGQDVYSFDIIGADHAIHEVLINANSGMIVSNKIESASAEAKEAAEDKQTSDAQKN